MVTVAECRKYFAGLGYAVANIPRNVSGCLCYHLSHPTRTGPYKEFFMTLGEMRHAVRFGF